jgi:hypothetical protein
MITGDKSFSQLQGSHSFTYHDNICCKTGICNDDSVQLSNVPYTEYSSDNRSALNPWKYRKSINFYGRLKICLQPDISVTTNRSRRFKCPNITVTANRAEVLKYSLVRNQYMAGMTLEFSLLLSTDCIMLLCCKLSVIIVIGKSFLA